MNWLGLLEAVYHEALEIELRERGIPFESHKELRILYKNQPLKRYYECDLLCYGAIMVELKTQAKLCPPEIEAQLLNYFKSTRLRN